MHLSSDPYAHHSHIPLTARIEPSMCAAAFERAHPGNGLQDFRGEQPPGPQSLSTEAMQAQRDRNSLRWRAPQSLSREIERGFHDPTTVLHDHFCVRCASQELPPSRLDVIAKCPSALQANAAPELPFAPIRRKRLRPRRVYWRGDAVLAAKYFLLLCLLCAMLLKIFYRWDENLAEDARLTR